MNSFFTSQFNYCPLVWMFHSRTMNNKINHNKTSSFEKFWKQTVEIYRSLQQSFSKKVKIWLLRAAVGRGRV